jgi:hypothetical protein
LWPPCRLHRDVCVDDFTFRQPEVQRNISRRHEDWVGLLHDLLKLGNRTLNALFHEPRLRDAGKKLKAEGRPLELILQLFRGFLLDAFRVDEFFNFVWRLKDLPRVWGS